MNYKDEPFVIEYNARMGDPETEVVLPRLQTDFVTLLAAAADQKLHEIELTVSPQTAVTTMLVSGGYPEDYQKYKAITDLEPLDDTIVFHAGTTVKNGQIVSNGGRVIAVTALANSLEGAVNKSQKMAAKIQFEGKYYRKDIGLDLIRYKD
jgi:phosphoribosylamine--glycine ligase